MIPIIFFIFLVGWLLIIFGLGLKEKIMLLISSFMLIIVGIYLFINGINGVNLLVLKGFSFINFGMGIYFLLGISIDEVSEFF